MKKDLLKINLRFFGDEESGETQEETVTDTDSNTEENQEEKKFTQADLDRIVEERLNRERRKSNKSPAEDKKTSNTTEDKQADVQQLQEQVQKLENAQKENTALRKGIDPESVDYAIFKASQLVSEEITFEKALDKVISEKGNLIMNKTVSISTGQSQTNKQPGELKPKDFKSAIEDHYKKQ